jgi:hypothetical protein
MPPDDARIAAELTALALDRGPGRSFCPSEAARALAADWRALMPAVRRVAGAMQDRGELRATQKGTPVHPATARGPIRLSLPAGRGGAG